MKLKKTWTLLFTLVIIYASYHLYTYWSFSPHKKAHPRYFVTISGNISPHLSKPIYLGYWAHYAAYNPKCGEWINWVEGVKGMPARTHFYPAKPNKSEDYVIKVPIDQYKAGRCDWKIEGIDMTMSFKKISSSISDNWWNWQIIVFGAKPKSLPGLPYNKNWTATLNSNDCIKKGFNNCGDALGATYASSSVLRNKNYHFIQNISGDDK